MAKYVFETAKRKYLIKKNTITFTPFTRVNHAIKAQPPMVARKLKMLLLMDSLTAFFFFLESLLFWMLLVGFYSVLTDSFTAIFSDVLEGDTEAVDEATLLALELSSIF